ncbi:AbrB/MazE/SpoVT family DNA-binding domain-containing protein [Sulfolobus sp. E5-1-F]|uniref:AbrB/MazE/SpoVT family DNA-binding domain-containing protein n=1 Tax=Sulfolobaceae TaxID=118883 RepID=UPI0012963AAE|nr:MULTISPECIES: AbrB/MazE/SpoVT family DNA-binding domain-containing protein [unclassified Sulfolobus]QGA55260.1 AbrB/MazE/SpoVT family DNA-binding domain-containing protein [Sulfolobus sp. E5-1-F]QGA68050.1 AbrB/MazE/SpoVT family DNA-binding domain-containing protein [Sulfolobus sp. E11-6]
MERHKVKVYKKGIIVIPKEIREKLGIKEGDIIELVVNGDKISIEKPLTLLDLFGIDGDDALEIAKEIVKERRKEVEREIRS